MMPIPDVVIFPFMMTPFVVGRESSVRALEEAGGDLAKAEFTLEIPAVRLCDRREMHRVTLLGGDDLLLAEVRADERADAYGAP